MRARLADARADQIGHRVFDADDEPAVQIFENGFTAAVAWMPLILGAAFATFALYVAMLLAR